MSKVTWHLDYGTAIGGMPDEIVGGDTYQGYIWPSDGAGLHYGVEDEDDAEAIVELLNDREALREVVQDLLKHYATGHEDNPEIKRARAVLG